MVNSEISPFQVDISKSEVERLYRKLKDTRLPGREVVPGAGNKYGMCLYLGMSKESSSSGLYPVAHFSQQGRRTSRQKISTIDGSTTSIGSLCRGKSINTHTISPPSKISRFTFCMRVLRSPTLYLYYLSMVGLALSMSSVEFGNHFHILRTQAHKRFMLSYQVCRAFVGQTGLQELVGLFRITRESLIS